MHSKKKNQSGFSLLEVLVGLFLITFISLGMVSTIDTVSSGLETLSKEDPPYFQVESFFQRMQQDLNSLYTPLYFTVEEQKNAQSSSESQQESNVYDKSETFPKVADNSEPIPVILNPEKNTLIFLVNNHRRVLKNSKQSNFAWIRYSVKANDNISEDEGAKDYPNMITRSVISENIFNPQFDWSNIKEVPILPNIKSMTISYWKKDEGSIGIKGKFVDNIELLNEEKYMPRLFKITVVWKNPESEEREFNRTFRVNWPRFDTMKDYKEYQKALKAQVKDNNNQNSNNPSNNPFGTLQTEGEEEGIEE